MPQIDWQDSFSVGNDEIDQQHRKWFIIFNNMHEALINGDAADYKSITLKSLQDMLDYARMHFNFEENYLAKINYPDLVAHRRLHKDFDTQIYQLYRQANDGNIVLNTEIIQMIRNWLTQHILIEDAKYKIFAQQQNNDATNTP